jgi:two-component system OmpR family response regulator
MNKRVLVVEDDFAIRNRLSFELREEGYLVTVADNAADALLRTREARPDLILLNLSIEGLTGGQVCDLLREADFAPAIMLTIRAGESNHLGGFQVAANAYLSAPVSLREMAATVHRLAGTVAARPEPADRVGRLRIDRSGRRMFVSDQELVLTPREWALLDYLLRHPGRVVSRRILLQEVWGGNHVRAENTVDVHIRWLRAKLDRLAPVGFRISTVRGSGYRLDLIRGSGRSTGRMDETLTRP